MFEKKIKRKKNRKKNKLKIPDDATNQAKSNIFGSDWKNEKMFWDPPSAKAPYGHEFTENVLTLHNRKCRGSHLMVRSVAIFLLF